MGSGVSLAAWTICGSGLKGSGSTSDPVSYTHLDVYKRQYERSMEWSFFVSEDALKRMQPDMPRDEAGLLNAFDCNRPLIYAAASKAFTRTRKGSYELVVTDF